MIYINNKDNNAIRKDVENLNKTQIENINMLRYLREKSDMYNKGFLMSVTALSVIDRINFLFDLCKVRTEKLNWKKDYKIFEKVPEACYGKKYYRKYVCLL